MFDIERIAKEIGIDKKFLEPYGNYKAKIDLNILNDLNRKNGKTNSCYSH